MKWTLSLLLLTVVMVPNRSLAQAATSDRCEPWRQTTEQIEIWRCLATGSLLDVERLSSLECRVANYQVAEGVTPPVAQMAATVRDGIRMFADSVESASCVELDRMKTEFSGRGSVGGQLSGAVPLCAGGELSEERRSAGAASMRRIASQPELTLDQRCYTLEERVAADSSPILLSPSVVVSSAYYGSGSRLVVLGGLDPNSRDTLRVSSLSSPSVGARVLQVGATVLGVGVPSADEEDPDLVAEYAVSGFTQRVVRVMLANGARVRIDGAGYGAEVDALSEVGVVVGASITGEAVIQPDGPVGSVSQLLATPEREATLKWAADASIFALSASAFIGVRYRDCLFAPGILVASTAGAPLQGVSFRIGWRNREWSRSVYYSIVGGLRWGDVPTTLGYPIDVELPLLPTETRLAGTIGLEFAFDVATVAGSPGGFVNALLGD